MGIEGTKIIGDEGLDADKLQAWLDSIAAWANGNVGLQSLVNRYVKSSIGFTLCADDDTVSAGVIPVDVDTGTPRVRIFTKIPLVEGLVTFRNILLTGQAMATGDDLAFSLWTYPDESFTPADAIQIAGQTLTNPGAAGWVYDYDERTFFPGDRRFIEMRLTTDDVEVWNRVTWCAELTWQLQEF